MENKKRYFKFIAGFFGIIAGVFILSNIVLWGWQKYEWRQQEKMAKEIQEKIKKLEQEDYQRAMADTYGGKTPQETLQMYIDAVEKGDFELASKYLIESKREEEIKSLIALKEKNNIRMFLDILSRIEPDGDIDGNFFRMMASIKLNNNSPYHFVRFMRYPNGLWKIIEA